MFDNILGKINSQSSKNNINSALIEKISKMHLTDMRVYVNNKLKNFEISEEGLSAVMRQLVSKDVNLKRFIESDAMDIKIKKAFDLVIVIAANKKMTITTSELIREFIELYADIIRKFDIDNKQIYSSRLKDALNNSLATLQIMTDMNQKMGVLGK